MERDGRTLYAVVMGSDPPGGHFEDSAALLDHGFEDYWSIELVVNGTTSQDPFDDLDTGEGALAAEASGHALVHLGSSGLLGFERVEEEQVVTPDGDVPAPVVPTSTSTLPDAGSALRWFFGGGPDG